MREITTTDWPLYNVENTESSWLKVIGLLLSFKNIYFNFVTLKLKPRITTQ